MTHARFILLSITLFWPALAGCSSRDGAGTPTRSASSASSADYGGYRPHYQGFGTTTPGGRGGTICRVTTTADAIPPEEGMLRYCTEIATGPRFVVFETSGTIKLTYWLRVLNPYVTIAGQTAPYPGISVTGASLLIQTNDVVIQHLRWRSGNEPGTPTVNSTTENMGLIIGGDSKNVVLDHNTFTWAIYEHVCGNLGMGGHNPYDFALLDNVFAESLYDAPGTGPWSVGLTPLGMGVVCGTVIPEAPEAAGFVGARNLIAHSSHRNPLIFGRALWYNNVSYNTGGIGHCEGPNKAAHGCEFMQFWTTNMTGPDDCVTPSYSTWYNEVAVIGNRFIPGPDTPANLEPIKIWPQATGSTLHLADNDAFAMTAADQWSGVSMPGFCGESASTYRVDAPQAAFQSFGITPLPVADVESFVLAQAGARPAERTATDARIIDSVQQRGGGIINCSGEWPGTGPWGSTCAKNAGGMPADEAVVTTQAYVEPADANGPGSCGSTIDGTPRTVIECDLEARARAVEGAIPSPVDAGAGASAGNGGSSGSGSGGWAGGKPIPGAGGKAAQASGGKNGARAGGSDDAGCAVASRNVPSVPSAFGFVLGLIALLFARRR